MLVFGLLAGPARAADPQNYTVDISGAPTPEIDRTLRASSQLVILAGAGPVPPFALVTRVRDDIPRLQTALDSFGYYQNKVSMTVAGLGPEMKVQSTSCSMFPSPTTVCRTCSTVRKAG